MGQRYCNINVHLRLMNVPLAVRTFKSPFTTNQQDSTICGDSHSNLQQPPFFVSRPCILGARLCSHFFNLRRTSNHTYTWPSLTLLAIRGNSRSNELRPTTCWTIPSTWERRSNRSCLGRASTNRTHRRQAQAHGSNTIRANGFCLRNRGAGSFPCKRTSSNGRGWSVRRCVDV